MKVPESTIQGLETPTQGVLAAWSRRAFLAVLLVFVLAGLAGFLGVRTATERDEGAGYTLDLRYAATARSGLDVPWQVTVTREGGFDKELTLTVTGDYFDIYETQGFTPEPTESTRSEDTLYLTFTAPEGDTFMVAYDAYIQPASQVGADGTLSVLEDGRPVASVDFDTMLWP
jgi:hypothetical protein